MLLASRASYEKKWACFIEPESEEKVSKNDTHKFILSLFKISLDLLKFLHQSGHLKNKLVSDLSYGKLTTEAEKLAQKVAGQLFTDKESANLQLL